MERERIQSILGWVNKREITHQDADLRIKAAILEVLMDIRDTLGRMQ